MTDGEMLPCPNPWCSSHKPPQLSEAYSPYVKLDRSGMWRVYCAVCPQLGPYGDDGDAAIAAWNTRAPTDRDEGYARGIEDAARAAWAETRVEWEASENDQHATRLRVCAERRRDWPGTDDECDHDGICSECDFDMAEAHETAASKARRTTAKRIHTAIRALADRQPDQRGGEVQP